MSVATTLFNDFFQASLLMLDVMKEPSPVISHIECTVKIAEQSEVWVLSYQN